jgi:hypothetical protein
MMTEVNKLISNISFDRSFQERIKTVEIIKKEVLHTNGMPHHYYLVFKLLCCLGDEDMTIEIISLKYREVFGRGINASALSRTLLYLSDKPKHGGQEGILGLISYALNPFIKDARFKGVALTKVGRILQKILCGETATTYQSKLLKQIKV